MKKTRIFAILLTLALAVTLLAPGARAIDLAEVSQSVADYHVQSEAALLVNATEDMIYYEQNAYERVYPASITKVMTALLILEAVDRGDMSLDDEVTAGSETWRGVTSDATTQNIQIGETMRLEDLLYCLLLPSANEAANILAQYLSGSVDSFVARMNARATELGCTGTHFANPHGMHDENHYTTCYDLYLIARQAMQNETFRTIVSTESYTVPATNMSEERTFYNSNGLLTSNYYSGYVYENCIGIKTGTTDAAGYCLLAAAEQDGTMLISVVMGADTVVDDAGTHRYQFSESSRLLQWGFDNFSVHDILTTTDPVAEVAVTLGVDVDSVLVGPEGSLQALLPNDVTEEDFTTDIQVVESVEAPVSRGDVLGTLTVYLQDQEYGSVDLVALDDVEQSVFLARKEAIETFIADYWLTGVIALAVILVLIVVLRFTLLRPKRRYGANYTGTRRPRNYKGGRRRR
ncbi:MAG TPA: D-alanyl-D-alanine carboxypeptidase [Candidatus Onthomonas avicola]|nr:D-alanyl-D-alanine carboxypeptidase [Candidatus Onthomonas avicola]